MTLAKPLRPEGSRLPDQAEAGLSMLAGLVRALGATATVEAAAALVAETAREAAGGATGALVLVEDQELQVLALTGYPEESSGEVGAGLTSSGSPSAIACESGEFRTWKGDERQSGAPPAPGAGAPEHPGNRSGAAVPLVVEGRPIGALQVGFVESRSLSAGERTALEMIADIGAQAIARIRMMEAERHGRQMMVASLEQLPHGVIIVDSRGEIIHLNENGRRIWLGSAWPGPVPETAPVVGYHPDGRRYERHEWPRYRSATTGEIVVGEEITIETIGGERVIVSASSTPVDDASGRRIGAVVVFSDVTDQSRAAAIREAFTGILSHELRTPITSIYGAAQLLSRRGETMTPENRSVLIQDVEAAAEHLAGLVENLLVLSRAEHNVTTVDVAPLLIHRVVGDLIQRESRTWPRSTVEVVTPGGPPPPVLGDESVVTLMLRNLVDNAAKYAPGQIHVVIEPAGDHVRISVRDHGPGIPPSELVSVFHLFHRSESTAGRAPGSGIGLFVVRHLAEAQGGQVWASNLPEGGADVGFSLPVAGDEDDDQ